MFGVERQIGETRRDKLAKTYVSILATDTQVVRAFGVGAIQQWLDENEGVLPYVQFRVDADLEEVLLSFKRFELVLSNHHIKRINEYRLSTEDL